MGTASEPDSLKDVHFSSQAAILSAENEERELDQTTERQRRRKENYIKL